MSTKIIHPDVEDKIVALAYSRLPDQAASVKYKTQHPRRCERMFPSDLKAIGWQPNDSDMTSDYVDVYFEYESGQQVAAATENPFWKYQGRAKIYYGLPKDTLPVDPNRKDAKKKLGVATIKKSSELEADRPFS